MANNSFIYKIPENTTKIGDLMMGTPQNYTDGMFLNLFLTGFFMILTIGAVQYKVQMKKAVIYSTFATFLLTFIISIAGYAGGNQLIPAAVAFIAVTAYTLMEGRIK